MKKEYIKPEMKVYEIEHQQLLAASDPEKFSLRDDPDDGNEEIF